MYDDMVYGERDDRPSERDETPAAGEERPSAGELLLTGLGESSCCFLFLISCLCTGLLVANGLETKEHFEGTIVSVAWSRSFYIEEDRGEKTNRGRIRWHQIDQLETTGTDRDPAWPKVELKQNQRTDFRIERYKCYVRCDDGRIRIYSTNDVNQWMLYKVDDRVKLGINGFEDVNSIAVVTSKAEK